MTALDRSDMPALAGEYVLGLLDAEQRREIEDQLQGDNALRDAIGTWHDRLSALDDTADSLSPSVNLWQRIEGSIDRLATPFSSRQAPDKTRARWLDRLWSNLPLWRGVGLAGALAALLLAVFTAGVTWRTPATPVAVALLADEATPGGPPGALVEAYADGSIRLVPLRDIPVPQDRTLQVWTLWDRAVGPVPLGTMSRAENVRLRRDGLPQPRRDQLYEITLEPAGGSPIGRPTGPVLYKGLATLIP